jgi:hypothetical protein
LDTTPADVGSASVQVVVFGEKRDVTDEAEETIDVDNSTFEVSVCSKPSIPMIVCTIPGLILNVLLEQEHDFSL